MQDRWKQWKNNNHKFETRQKFLFLCFLRAKFLFSFFCLRSPNGTETRIHCSQFQIVFGFRVNRKLFAVSVAKSWITEMCSFSINVMDWPQGDGGLLCRMRDDASQMTHAVCNTRCYSFGLTRPPCVCHRFLVLGDVIPYADADACLQGRQTIDHGERISLINKDENTANGFSRHEKPFFPLAPLSSQSHIL